MKVLYKNGLILDVAYIVNNNGSAYYQRGIPKDLRARFNKAIIRIKLDSEDKHHTLAQQALRYAKTHDQLFSALRANKDLVVSEQKILALTLLRSFNLDQRAGDTFNRLQNDENLDDSVIGNIADFFDYYESQEKSGQLTQIDRLAKATLNAPLPLLLSEAINHYLDNHPKGKDPSFIKKTNGRWDKFIEIVGDVALISIDRDMARKYRDSRLKQTYGKKNPEPVKTATVEREIKAIRAIINKVAKEEDLNLKNPFESISISGLGSDSKTRESFTKQELTKLLKSCIRDFDEIRCLIILQACTGARIAEIAGLRKTDIHKQGDIQYLSICEYGQRSVKTKNSIRQVPLVDLALKALAKHKESLPATATTLFPRYADGKSVNNNAVSATTNKYIRSLGINKTSHSLRHCMRDLLRNANVPLDLAHEIGGWGSQQIAEQYGHGHALKVKLEALKSAFNPIKVDTSLLTIKSNRNSLKSPLKSQITDSNKAGSFIGKLSEELGRKVTKKDIALAVKAKRGS